jgi:hypothetical protein
MVVFSAGLVVYYSYRAVLDALQDLRRERMEELSEPDAHGVKSVGTESAPAAYVVGKEKLTKILATRGKRLKHLATHGSPSWRPQGAIALPTGIRHR